MSMDAAIWRWVPFDHLIAILAAPQFGRTAALRWPHRLR
jgi:hypothetical protein